MNKETNPNKLTRLQNLQQNTLDMLKELVELKEPQTQKMLMSLSSVSKELNILIIKEIIGEIEDE